MKRLKGRRCPELLSHIELNSKSATGKLFMVVSISDCYLNVSSLQFSPVVIDFLHLRYPGIIRRWNRAWLQGEFCHM
jgi:hypothetical protein